MTDRPPIPDPVKRQVRTRCGFGCVFCGLPLYEYDHIYDWAKTQQHKAQEITLLCNKHHAEKTKGLLTTEQVVTANQNPINARRGISSPYGLHFAGGEATVLLGGVALRFTPPTRNEPVHRIAVSIDDNVCDNFHWRDLRGLGKLLAYVFAVTFPRARSERWKRRHECRRSSSPNR
jgi:hypothetical protein